MKKGIFLLLLIQAFSVIAQITISGKVISKKNVPLEGASVYLNNTTLGTITDAKGEFSFTAKEGQFELIISYLGFEKVKHPFNTSTLKKPFTFILTEKENLLDEVIVKKVVFDEEWKHNLALFKREFLGKTEFAKECKILNPKVIYFDFDPYKNILRAYAKEPLQIVNKSLGYHIIFELESFVRTKKHISYLGYSKYKELKGGKNKQKKWKANRFKAYKGSPVHFFKSVINNTFDKEGFIANQFKRLPNPDRPSELEIQRARELIKLNNKPIRFSLNKKQPKTVSDSAMVTLNKTRLPKFKDFLYKSKLKKDEIISLENNLYRLTFNDHLIIVYNQEKEEDNYVINGVFGKKREPLNIQTSAIIQQRKNSILDTSGVLINPLNIFYEGYWAYEKFANSLPLDYQPK